MNERKRKEKVKTPDAVLFVAVAIILFGFFAPWYVGCSGHDIASAGNHEFFLVPVLPLAAAIVLIFGLRLLSVVLMVLGTANFALIFSRFIPDEVQNIEWGLWLTAAAYVLALFSSAVGASLYSKRRQR
jgi:hypothetical protein